jgi:phosphoribosylaminoimidazolecarboxamide formyltransferase/IMP cyclohydrolase
MPLIRRALLSVWDKTGLEQFARGLVELGIELLSTGGTAGALARANLPVRQLSDYIGLREILGGRVKTLHPKVHGALLAKRDDPDHVAQAQALGIEFIDMVVVNLYPFPAAPTPEASLQDTLERIDIGGHALLRAAVKNFQSVAAVCCPALYEPVLRELKESGGQLSEATCARLAAEAMAYTAEYDACIQSYLSELAAAPAEGPPAFPRILLQRWQKETELRYGENPHQRAALYARAGAEPSGLLKAVQHWGPELSFTNYLDLQALLDILGEFPEPAAAIVKHTSPCGVAADESIARAYRAALECDPISAFGGLVGVNRPLDEEAAEAILNGIKQFGFLNAVLAPGFQPEAMEKLKTRKSLRIMELSGLQEFHQPGMPDSWDFRPISGGLLVQEPDAMPGAPKMQCVTKKEPAAEVMVGLQFAAKVVKHVKSNAIVLARDKRAVGIASGLTSRVDAVELAVKKAGERAEGAVLASEAYFPKPDAVQAAASAGIVAILQPGGSLRDGDIIAACDELGVAMVFTGVRHFKH